MKKRTNVLTILLNSFVLIGILSLASCKKDEESCTDGIKNQDEVQADCGGICQPCSIEYPSNGTYGANLLHGNDTLWTNETNNSFRAIVPEGSTLKIEMNLISGNSWAYDMMSNVGWSISNYYNNQQTLYILNPGTSDLQLVKGPDSGTDIYLIKYFENSSTETRRKIVVMN